MFGLLALLVIVVLGAGAVLAIGEGRKYLLYAYVTMSSCIYLIHGYFHTTNYLGIGKEWSFLDVMLLCLLVFAWPTSNPAPYTKKADWIDIPMTIIILMVILGFVVGFLRSETIGVLNYSRRFLFVPIYFVAVKIFVSAKSVDNFFKFIKWFIIFFFIIQILLSTGMYTPPLPESVQERLGGAYTSMIRVAGVITESLYLFGVAVSLSALLYRRPRAIFNWIILSLSLIGAILSQTRGIYLSVGIIFLGAFALLRGRAKIVILIVLSMLVIYVLMVVMHIPLLYRFTEGHNAASESPWDAYWHGWRGQEYGVCLKMFMKEPQWFLTGRGFGAMQPSSFSNTGYVNFYHNEYLKTLNSIGFVGLVSYLILLVGCIFYNKKYAHVSDIGFLLSPGRLIALSVIPASIFGGYTWSPGTGPLILCFLAIARNGDIIADRVYGSEAEEINDIYWDKA